MFFFYFKFTSRQFTPRTKETYDYHCSLLEGSLSKEDSVTYGISFRSPLNQLKHFNVVDNLPQDVMHLLFEGVLPYEITLMLRSFVIVDKYFSLDMLNARISSFTYTNYEAKDKPSAIQDKILTTSKNLSQSCKLCTNASVCTHSCYTLHMQLPKCGI